jgi:TRAP-type C4-dicarboxylate transport system substrate-binding protein
MARFMAAAALGLSLLLGCSPRSLAVGALADSLAGSGSAFTSDDDPELVREAMPFTLKTIETLLADQPDHRGLLLAAASGFTQYAHAFILQDADVADPLDVSRARAMRLRAKRLLLRARDYALRGLPPGFEDDLRRDRAAALATTTKDVVPFLYWAGAAWASALLAQKRDLDLVADLPIAGALLQRVVELDETFGEGAAHEALISYEGSRSEAMGGSAARARGHYARALALSGGRRASVHLALAESVCVREQNVKEFRALADAALAVDPDADLGIRLANILARRRAAWLLTRIPDLFVESESDTILLTIARAQDQTVKLGTLAPEGSAWHDITRDMAESWKKATDGKVVFRIYAGGVAGDEPDMVRKLRIGQLHAAALTGAGLSEIAPEINGVQLPMLVRTYAELDHVMAKLAPHFEKALKEKGFTVLNWGDAGWVHFFSKKPVVTVDDLRKTKLCVWAGSNVDVAVWKDAGVQPVPLAATEIHTGLESGLVNAFSTTPLAALSFQWFGSAKNMTDLRWAPLIGATVISTKKWEQLPASARPVLLKAAKESGERLKTETRKLGDEAVTAMKKHGLAVHAVPEAATAMWESQARAAWPKIMGNSIPEDLVKEIEKLLAEYRDKNKGK